MTAELARPTPSAVVGADFAQTLPIRRQRTPEQFQAAVAAAVEEIRAGEAFQIVVSQRFEVDTTADALDVYRVLRLLEPEPVHVSAPAHRCRRPRRSTSSARRRRRWSPSRARPRSPTRSPVPSREARRPRRTRRWRPSCSADPKERAEHVMLVDLGRNDLGRVCRPGTVAVVEFMEVRRYSHIMHLESTVIGQLADGRTALDAVLAAFPAGTLSGAPKVRAMEIIDDLEVVPPGAVRRGRRLLRRSAATRTRRSPSGPRVLRRRHRVRPGRRRDRRRLPPADRGPGVAEQGRRGGPRHRRRPDLCPAG